jgi:hypothetical protein
MISWASSSLSPLKVISTSVPRWAPAGEIEASCGAVAHAPAAATKASQNKSLPPKPEVYLKHVTNSDDVQPKLFRKKLKKDDRLAWLHIHS